MDLAVQSRNKILVTLLLNVNILFSFHSSSQQSLMPAIHQVYPNILRARNTMLSFEMKKLGGDSLSPTHAKNLHCQSSVLDICFSIQCHGFVYRQRAAAKGQEAEAGRRKQLPAPDGNSGPQVLGIHSCSIDIFE